jgi:urease accessory protein
MLVLTHCLPTDVSVTVNYTLCLTAEERTRSRYRFQTAEGIAVTLQLPRGTTLLDGDLLRTEDTYSVVRVVAKPEPVLTVTAKTPLVLLRAAYHLGNRHVPLEITATYLRLSPDSVLRSLLEHLGLQVTEEFLPFQPELGAYAHPHQGTSLKI